MIVYDLLNSFYGYSCFNKKIFLKLLCFISFYIGALHAQEIISASAKELDIQNLNQKIISIQNQIKEERLAIFKAEDEAQILMFFEWNAYAKKMQQIEKHEGNIIQLKKKLKPLIDQRINLLKKPLSKI